MSDFKIRLEDVSSGIIRVGRGVTVPESWSVVVNGEKGVPGEITVRVAYDRRLGRVVADEVLVKRPGHGGEVTSLTLREVRVQTIVQATALRLVGVPLGEEQLSLSEFMTKAKTLEWGPREMRAAAATVYLAATTAAYPPLKSVATAFNVSQSTATRVVARAREDASQSAHAPGPHPSSPTQSRRPSIG